VNARHSSRKASHSSRVLAWHSGIALMDAGAAFAGTIVLQRVIPGT